VNRVRGEERRGGERDPRGGPEVERQGEEEPRRAGVEEEAREVREDGRAVSDRPLEPVEERRERPEAFRAGSSRALRRDEKAVVPDPSVLERGHVERGREQRGDHAERGGAERSVLGGARGGGGPRGGAGLAASVLGFLMGRHGGRVPGIDGRVQGSISKGGLGWPM
jgi:hypothetical protein